MKLINYGKNKIWVCRRMQSEQMVGCSNVNSIIFMEKMGMQQNGFAKVWSVTITVKIYFCKR